jgi:hypothetical protein
MAPADEEAKLGSHHVAVFDTGHDSTPLQGVEDAINGRARKIQLPGKSECR